MTGHGHVVKILILRVPFIDLVLITSSKSVYGLFNPYRVNFDLLFCSQLLTHYLLLELWFIFCFILNTKSSLSLFFNICEVTCTIPSLSNIFYLAMIYQKYLIKFFNIFFKCTNIFRLMLSAGNNKVQTIEI